MLNLNVNANFSGTSMHNEIAVASFNASYVGEKQIYISMNVEDHELYFAHKADVDADFKAFTDKVLESIAELED